MGETPWGTEGAVGYNGPKCRKCGRQIERRWAYCPWCGASKEEQEEFQKRSESIKEGLAKKRRREDSLLPSRRS